MKRKRPFCNAGCKESYQSDRALGLIYGSWLVPAESVPENVQSWPPPQDHEGMLVVGWEDGSRINNTCAYCGAELN